ncbi:MAG: beta-ketoacyl-ACP synthase II [Acidimicrobiia bacterium]|nr:beta-ketoacyl-ACP synthase II [Acidimicrobiia bacterium]
MRRRVAVTGLGAVSTCGIGAEALWNGLLGPAPEGLRHVEDFDPLPWFDNPKEARRVDRFAQFALACAAEALADAGELAATPERRGVIIGTGVGGLHTLEDQIMTFHTKGPRRVSPFLVPMMMSNAGAAAVSMRHGWQGPCETIVTACAAGTQSIAYGARLIADGRCDAVLAGSSEAALTPVGIQGFINMTALSTSGVSMPFDARRDGFMMAEGAAVLVLEEWEQAHERGATVLAEVLGGASSADAHHITAPAPNGAGALRCMTQALTDAGLSAGDVVHVNAHGTSTPLNDAAEAHALAELFGGADAAPPVTANKGVLGHALGAAGALEAVACVLSMRHGIIPPTAGYSEPDPDLPALDVVHGDPRPWTPGPTLSNSFGFGGHNGSIVLAPAE